MTTTILTTLLALVGQTDPEYQIHVQPREDGPPQILLAREGEDPDTKSPGDCWLRDTNGEVARVRPGHPDWHLCGTAPATDGPVLSMTEDEARRLAAVVDEDGRMGAIREEPAFGDQLRAWSRSPMSWALLESKDREHRATLPADVRSLPGYDCLEHGGDCPPAPAVPEPALAEDRPWPDWRDASTFFYPERKSWVVLDSRDESAAAFIDSEDLLERWVAHMRQTTPGMWQPVLVVNSDTFLVNAAQIPFFLGEQRRCPTCVTIEPLSGTSARFRESVALKLRWMAVEGMWSTDALQPDTRIHVRGAWTQDERAVLEQLATIVDRETERLATLFASKGAPSGMVQQVRERTVLNLGQATGDFVRDWMLVPGMLPFVQLVGPSLPEERVASAQAEIGFPSWVRFAYAEWDDTRNAFRMASDAWMAAGKRAIQRRCPRCETWSDWYCGSGATARLETPQVRIRCVPKDEPGTWNLLPNRYLPGDTSVPGQMYTFELRRGTTWGQYLENQVPIIDPEIELPSIERMQFLRTIATANELADRWLGGGQ